MLVAHLVCVLIGSVLQGRFGKVDEDWRIEMKAWLLSTTYPLSHHSPGLGQARTLLFVPRSFI